jgi:fido (protein-threonine AMPylation protein)
VKARRQPGDWSIAFLYEVHRAIFIDIFPQDAGKERRVDVALRDLPVPPAAKIQYRLQSIVEAIRTLIIESAALTGEEKLQAVFAAAARIHADCVAVQPFIDGNKRWARLILSALLTDCGYYPGTEIAAADHDRYMDGISKCVLDSHPEQLGNLILAGYLSLRQAYRAGTRSGFVPY